MTDEVSIENEYKSHLIYTNYGANRRGDVKNLKTDRVLRPYNDLRGYFSIALYKDGRRKHYKVHRFVYECFYGLISYRLCINHKDLNKKSLCARSEPGLFFILQLRQ